MSVNSTNPLVSVVVVSYNSADTVIETLDSVLNQTYKNIELILSDDFSQDNTVSIATDWFNQHKKAFPGGAYLLTAEKNQGVCGNFNKAIRSSKGKWIKIIAADDILLPNCCEDYVDYALKNPEAHFITGQIDIYDERFDSFCLRKIGVQPVPTEVYNGNVDSQLKIAARTMIISGSGVFYSRHLFETIGGYDTKYPFEDWPSVISALEKGYKVYLVEKSTVGYRLHSSLSNKRGRLYNIHFKRKIRVFFIEKCFKYLQWKTKMIMIFQWVIEEFLDFSCLNRDNKTGRKIEHLLTRIKNKDFDESVF